MNKVDYDELSVGSVRERNCCYHASHVAEEQFRHNIPTTQWSKTSEHLLPLHLRFYFCLFVYEH